jgi:hypothetical protein
MPRRYVRGTLWRPQERRPSSDPGLQVLLQVLPPGLHLLPPGLKMLPPGLQVLPPGLQMSVLSSYAGI